MNNDYFDHPHEKKPIETKTMKTTSPSNNTITPRNFRSLRRLCGMGIAAIGFAAPLASADSTFPVTNGGFEDPTPHNPNNGQNSDWTAGGWAFIGAPWTTSTANYGRLSQGPVASPQLGNWMVTSMIPGGG